jgi:FlaA1/EpsC-like NDP-sugar epimerase
MKEPAQPASIVQSWAAPDLGRSFGAQTTPGWTPAERPTSEREERPPKPRLAGGTWARIAYGVIDVVLICLNALIAVYVRFTPDILHRANHLHQFGLGPAFPYSRYVAFLLLYTTLIVLFCQGQDLYRTPRNRSAADETLGVTKAVSLATLFLTGFVFLSGYQQVSRIVVLMASVLNIATLSAWRFWKRKFVVHRVTQGFGARNALIVGAGAVGQALAAYL